jgi:heme/copper-type cytochrome/quinol oxidase subunit 2
MIFILLAMFFLVLFIVVLFIVAKRGTNTLNEEERDDMVKQVYQYAVAFITLVMVIGGGIFAFMSVADYVSPNTYVESFEDYKNMRDYKGEGGNVEKEEISEEELRAKYDAMVEQQIENSKQFALNSFIKSLGWIIIPLPVFLFFQRRISREKKNRS